ncbi:MAG: PDZ domain-containing protein [Planctomycetes bacterium]|nr:PDZ domain-containing protein [Planctomycetota bacterium]
MTTKATMFLLLALTVGGPGLLAQQETPAPAGEQPQAKPPAATAETWVERLGADEFAERQAAEKALRELGEGARAALKSAAESHPDPEVRFRARQLLRELDGEPAGLRPRDDSPQGQPRGDGQRPQRDEIDSMFDEIGRLFGDDRFGRDQFRDLHEQIRRMQESMRSGRALGGVSPFGLDHGTSIQITPDGVRVELKDTDENGKETTEVYEAPSIEAFKTKYPEIADKVFGPGGSFRIGIGPQDAMRPFQGFPPFPQLPGVPGLRPLQPLDASTPPPEGERLGVTVQPLPVDVAAFLDLEPGVGLVVGEVTEGSLGEELGLHPRDIILSIEGRAIRDVGDVREALRPISKGQPVHVEILRIGAPTKLEAKKLADAPAQEAGDSGGQLKPRGAR